MSIKCDYCDTLIVPQTEGLCSLKCSHQLHERCLFTALDHCGSCPKCADLKRRSIYVENMGQDPLLSRIHMETILAQLKKKQEGGFLSKMHLFVNNIFSSKSSAAKAVQARTPWETLKREYVLTDLMKHDVTVDMWLQHGYTMDQLMTFQPTWEDLVAMGLKLTTLPTKQLLSLFPANQKDMLKCFAFTLHELIAIQPSAEFMESVQLFYPELKSRGFEISHFTHFPHISLTDWAKRVRVPYSVLLQVKSNPALLQSLRWAPALIDSFRPKHSF